MRVCVKSLIAGVCDVCDCTCPVDVDEIEEVFACGLPILPERMPLILRDVAFMCACLHPTCKQFEAACIAFLRENVRVAIPPDRSNMDFTLYERTGSFNKAIRTAVWISANVPDMHTLI